ERPHKQGAHWCPLTTGPIDPRQLGVRAKAAAGEVDLVELFGDKRPHDRQDGRLGDGDERACPERVPLRGRRCRDERGCASAHDPPETAPPVTADDWGTCSGG